MRILEKLKLSRKNQVVLIVILSITCLVLLLFSFSNQDKDQETTNNYVLDLEKRLESTLSKIDGVGKVSVVINVESGMETVLAYKKIVTENAGGTQIEETPIIINGQTIVLKELFPKVVGVLIVAEGVENISVLSKVQQATISLLDINVNQIEILSMD